MSLNAPKFSIQLFGRSTVRLICFLGGRTTAKMNSFTLEPNHGPIVVLFADDSLKPRSVVALLWAIVAILPVRYYSQIFSTIIESVVVDMIALAFISARKIENLTMHTSSCPPSVRKMHVFRSIKVVNLWTPKCKPFMPVDGFEVGIVNKCHLTKRKRNFFHGSIIQVLV